MSDETELRGLLASAVPQPPAVPDRAERARAHALVRRRRWAVAAAVGSVAVIAAVAVPALPGSTDSSPAPNPTSTPETTSSAPAVVAGDFSCPSPWMIEGAPQNPAEEGPSTLPSGAVAVRLCSGDGEEFGPEAPLDPLVTDVGELVSLINQMPRSEHPRACHMDLGPTLGLAFQYADGSLQVAQAQRHGCGGVMVGGQLRGDRLTAWQPVDRFRELLLAQRSESQAPELTMPLGCQGPTSIITSPEPPVELTRAVLCWRHVTQSETPTLSAPIPADDLAVLLDDLNSNTTHQEITEEECREQTVALTIVGRNPWGDRVALYGDCGPFNLTQDNANVWRPNVPSQAILDGLVAAGPLTLLEPTPDTPPDQVIAVWADLVNAGELERADALWQDNPPPSEGSVELKIVSMHAPGWPAAVDAEVTALHRVVPADGSFVDYHEVVFTLRRPDIDARWRIVSMVDNGRVPTGR